MKKQHFYAKLNKLFNKLEPIFEQSEFISFERAFSNLLASTKRLPNIVYDNIVADITGINIESIRKDPKDAESIRVKTVSALQDTTRAPFDVTVASRVSLQVLGRLQLKRNQFYVGDHYETVFEMPTTTSSAYPAFKTPKRDMIPNALSIVDFIIGQEDITSFIYESSIMYFAWRVQERESGTKTRIFYPLPQFFTILESKFFVPIKRYFEGVGYDIHNSYSWHSSFPEQKIIWNQAQNYKYIYCLDYPSMDQNTKGNWLYYNMLFIKSLFRLNATTSAIFDGIISVICYGMIAVNTGTDKDWKPDIVRKTAGIPSASAFTNFLGTCVVLHEVLYAFDVLGINHRNRFIKVKGDDVIICSHTPIRMDAVLEVINSSFSRDLKEFETFGRGEPIYHLGYWFTNNSRTSSSLDLTFRKMVVQGRFILDEQMSPEERVVARIVSILSELSDGYYIFVNYIQEGLLREFELDSVPDYYHDLVEYPEYDPSRVRNVWDMLRTGWRGADYLH